MKPQSKDERLPLCRACAAGRPRDCLVEGPTSCEDLRAIWDDAIAWFRHEHDLCEHGRELGCCLDCSRKGPAT